MAKKIYKERQYFLRSNFRWILGAIGLMALLIVIREYLNPNFTMQFSDIIAGVLASGLLVAAAWFLLKLKIKTAISEKGIEYKMFPFHKRKHLIPWEQIRHIEVIDTPRNSSWQSNYNTYMLQRKFTFSGRRGISIELCNGEYIFLGSSRVSELSKALEKASDKFELPICA